MILAIDVGNTNIVLGLYDSDKMIANFRVSTDRDKTEDEYGMLILELFKFRALDLNIQGAIISSVVPNIVATMKKMCERFFNITPLIVGPGIKTGLEIKYENPKEVGADRIVNAVAVVENHQGPAIIVDFGTATTFCAITANAEYLGGSIAPGIGISSEALFSRTAKLPKVDITRPSAIIGRNTVASMQSGIYYGAIGQVDEIIRRMKEEFVANEYGIPKVIATGGLAHLIATDSKEIEEVDEFLTLKGLFLIYNKNV
jgi:pantothenate kinase, type III